MPREWLLNSVMSRFQLNYKRNVGATSESIRECAPENMETWRKYYFNNVRSQEHITDLGKKLYSKVTGVISEEIKEVTEQECVDYMTEMVIDRTYKGYINEKAAIKQIKSKVKEKIYPASDEWDRKYNVDFYIKVGDALIGLQIKPIHSNVQIPQIYKEQNIQKNTHQEWRQKFRGKVFYIYSKAGSGKMDNPIENTEVIEEVLKEIQNLK